MQKQEIEDLKIELKKYEDKTTGIEIQGSINYKQYENFYIKTNDNFVGLQRKWIKNWKSLYKWCYNRKK